MLYLTRKVGEAVVINDEIEVTVPEGIGPGDDFEVSVEVSSPRCADRWLA